MKKNFKSFIGGTIVAAVFAVAPSVSAQNLQTGYFDDNYMYRFQSNPAFANEGKGFVAMPGLGNMNVGTNGTLGVNHIFYNVNGQTTTMLNPGVSASEALDGIKNKSRIGVSFRETVLAGGFKAWGGYNTVSINARADVGVALPKDIFRLAKEGLSNTTYDLSDISARGAVWAEIGFGHSRQIMSNLRVGATLKVLVGAGSVYANVKDAKLRLMNDTWVGEVNAELNGSIDGLGYKTSYNEDTKRDYVDGFDLDGFGGPDGYGVALDLGAVYTLNQDWEFSASLLDLGFISWSNNMVATTNGLQGVSTNDYSFNVDNNESWDDFVNNLSKLYQLEDKGDQGSRTTGIGATMNLAAQYTLPVYRKARFGFLNTTRINGNFSWTDFRLSGTVEPVKCFSATASMGMGTFGFSFGWMLNVKVPGFNFFLASDRTPFKLAKPGVPLNSNMNINLGMNFPF